MVDKFKYRAFISYSSHEKKLGSWLHKALETYRVPRKVVGTAGRDGPVPKRLFPIFRDREELSASADLSKQIVTALTDSACLVVICSPRSAMSRWVNEEVLTFKRMGREGRIFAIIVDGEPNAEDKAGVPPDLECFPPGLRFRLGSDKQLSAERTEPIAADAREQADGTANAILKVVAGILGISYDALKRREDRRRLIRLLAAAAVAATALGAIGLYAWQTYDTGYLFAESEPVNSTITIDDAELGSRIKKLKLRSGAHQLLAQARDHFEFRRSITIPRHETTTTRFWLEEGFEWKPYTSPAIQGGLVLIPGADDTIVAHNELTRIVFLSTSTGSIVSSVPTPAGNTRAFMELDLGGDVGRVIVSAFDAERSGPDVLVLRASLSADQLWRWQGPATNFEKSDGISVTVVHRPARAAAIAVAGRDGHVYLLDGATGAQIADVVISPTPLPSSPTLIATEKAGVASLAAFFRQPAATSDGPRPLHGALVRFPAGEIVWRRDYGTPWEGPTPALTIEGVPHVVLWNDSGWRVIDISSGATRSSGTLPGRIFGSPAFADLEGRGASDLIFQFRDPSQPMLAVRATDAATLWQGPNGLSALRQTRSPGNTVPRTSGGLLLVNLEGALAAVDPHDGRVVWKVAGNLIDVLIGDWNGDGKDEILVGMGGVGLLCLDENGRVLWTLRMEDRDVRPWALVKSKQGGATSDILVHRHASLIGLVHGPRVLWEQQGAAALQATPVVARIENGKSVVVEIANWGGDANLRAFDAVEGGVRWSAKEQFSPNRGATLADLDGDGGMSIVALGSRPGIDSLHLLSYRPSDGKILRAVPIAVPGWLSCAPVVADFRGIGKSDVAFTTWDDRSIVMADGRTGKVLWRHKTKGPNMQGVGAGDLDGDGKPDVVAASFDGFVYGLRGGDGALLWKAPFAGGGWSNPVVARLDADGPSQVLVVSTLGRLHVFNARTGAQQWASNVAGGAKVTGHPVVVDNDGRKVILAPLGNAGVVAFDWANRSELWRSPARIPVIASPAVADFGGTKNGAVVVTAVTGDVFVLRLTDGKSIWRNRIMAEMIEADPVVADLDGDGIPDILIAGYNFRLHALSGAGSIGAR